MNNNIPFYQSFENWWKIQSIGAEWDNSENCIEKEEAGKAWTSSAAIVIDKVCSMLEKNIMHHKKIAEKERCENLHESARVHYSIANCLQTYIDTIRWNLPKEISEEQ